MDSRGSSFLFLNWTDCATLMLSHAMTCSLLLATVYMWGSADPAAFQVTPVSASHLFYFSFPFCKCPKWAAPPSVMKMSMIYFLTYSWIISRANRTPILVLTWMSFVLYLFIIWIMLILYLLRCGNLHQATLNRALPLFVWMFCLWRIKAGGFTF